MTRIIVQVGGTTLKDSIALVGLLCFCLVLHAHSLCCAPTHVLSSCKHARSLVMHPRTFPLSCTYVPSVLHARSLCPIRTFPRSCRHVPSVLSCTHICTFPLSCLHTRSLCPVLHARSLCPVLHARSLCLVRTTPLSCTHIPSSFTHVLSVLHSRSLCTFPLNCTHVPSVLHARTLCPAYMFPLSCTHIPSVLYERSL